MAQRRNERRERPEPDWTVGFWLGSLLDGIVSVIGAIFTGL